MNSVYMNALSLSEWVPYFLMRLMWDTDQLCSGMLVGTWCCFSEDDDKPRAVGLFWVSSIAGEK